MIPVEDCKKRWKALRDGYMKTQRIDNDGKIRTGLFTKLDFLTKPLETKLEEEQLEEEHLELEEPVGEETEQEVIMDNQEYYEVSFTSMDKPKMLPKYPPVRLNSNRKSLLW